MGSLIAPKTPGSTCQRASTNHEVLVKVVIQDEYHLFGYGMIAHSFTISEAENVAVTPSIGDNLFVYCTNSAPVQINLKGVIGYTESDGRQFGDLFKNDRVGFGGKILNLIIDKISYKAILTSYSRDYTTTPTPVDNCALSFLAVRV